MTRTVAPFALLAFALLACWAALFFTTPVDRPSGLFRKETAGEPRISLRPGVEEIDLGYEPLQSQATHVIEVMRRDRILAREIEKARSVLRFIPYRRNIDMAADFDWGLDAAILGALPAVQLAAKPEAHVVARFQSACASFVCRGAQSLDEFKGQRIGYVRGSITHQMLFSALARARVSVSDVILVPQSGVDPIDELLTEKMDAVVAMEPVPTLALRNFPGLAAVGHVDANLYLAFSRKMFQARQNLIERIVAAEIRALFWLKLSTKHLHMASGWVRQTLDPLFIPGLIVDLFDFDRLATEYTSDIRTLVGVLQQARLETGELREEYEFAKQQGLIPGSTPWERLQGLLHLEIVEKVMERPDEYSLRSFDMDPKPVFQMEKRGM